jgi:hypothetical protein
MFEVPIAGRNDGGLMNQFLACYDVPAYVRRARRVQEAFEELLARCRRQRDEWLRMVRVRLALLKALAGDWSRLTPWLADEGETEALGRLDAELAPRLRYAVAPVESGRVLRRAVDELCDSIERFNHRWANYLPTIELEELNALRDGYNRYFILEKECAVRSSRVARQGFRPLAPLTLEELTALLPPLPVPRRKM